MVGSDVIRGHDVIAEDKREMRECFKLKNCDTLRAIVWVCGCTNKLFWHNVGKPGVIYGICSFRYINHSQNRLPQASAMCRLFSVMISH